MPRPQHTLNAAMAYLAEHGETQAGKLADALRVGAGTLTSAMNNAVVKGTVAKRKDGHSCFYSIGTGDAPVPADPVHDGFNASLWADGDLVLYGVELNEDGSTLTLGRARVAMLRRLLNGSGVAA